MVTWQRFQSESQRGYLIGERNPATLPDGSNSRENPRENEVGTRRWRAARAWAMQPGGKYV